MRDLLRRLTAAVLLLGAAALQAQDWPTRPLRIVVPYAAGGNTDAIARLLAPRLAEALGQGVTVENRAGGGGVIATEFVAKAAPDGYTLLMSSTGPHVVMPALSPKIPFDPVRDLAPVSNVGSNALVLLVHPTVPAKSVAELVALLKREPDKWAIGSGGVASTTHMSGEMFKAMAGVSMTHIPFKGGAPLAVAALAGDVPISFNNMFDALPHMKTGKLRGLAVTSARRQPSAPELPTIAESGLPGYESGPWNGIVAPGRTPPEIVNRLSAAIQRIVREPAFQSRLADIGSVAIGDTPEQFRATIAAELARWAKVVRDSGTKLE
ncbi:MAG: tripartite tricarboxylate transporter substrate binding protein [Burkholderiales bacterium]|nr:tripartite tricarboxylate transporter substrate binding protein [Burkholderiales bacterium]